MRRSWSLVVGRWSLVALLLLVLAGCARQTKPEARPSVRQRVKAAVEKRRASGTVKATGAQLAWEDEEGRPLLEVRMDSVEGAVSAATGMEGPVTLHQARCRLYEDGVPTTWLNAPRAVWNAGRLVAEQGVKAGSLDGRMSAEAQTATWTAEKKLLEMNAPACRVQQERGQPALLTEGPKAHWTGGVLSLPDGVRAHTSDGTSTMRAQWMSWRASSGKLWAGGQVEIQRAEARMQARQLAADTQLRRVRCTGSPRLEIGSGAGMKRRVSTNDERRTTNDERRRMGVIGGVPRWRGLSGEGEDAAQARHSRWGATSAAYASRSSVPAVVRRSSLVVRRSSALLAVGLAFPSAAAVPQKQRKLPAQHMVLLGNEFDGDWLRLNGEFLGNASLTSPELTVSSGRILVKGEKGGNRLASASAVGSVSLKTETEEGAQITATGAEATYVPPEDRATLTGGVRLQFSSPQLAEPGTLTGDRVELTLSTGRAIVTRTTANPVTVVLKPKTGEGAVELRADRVEVDTRDGLVTATGGPVMKHPRGTLAADKIWFELDKAANDVREAKAEGNVRVHSAREDGRVADGTAQRAVLLRAENKVRLEGSVRITEKAPDVEEPSELSGETVLLDLKTHTVHVSGGGGKQVQIKTPVRPKVPAGATRANPNR